MYIVCARVCVCVCKCLIIIEKIYHYRKKRTYHINCSGGKFEYIFIIQWKCDPYKTHQLTMLSYFYKTNKIQEWNDRTELV